MKKVLIIGGGQAGCMTAIRLRQLKFEGEITIATEENYLPYQRPPLSKGYLVNKAKIESLYFKSSTYYEKNNVRVIKKKKATGISREKKQVYFDDKSSLGFDYLVIATGSELNKIEQKKENEKIVYLNNLGSAKQLKKLLETSKNIGVIGAGFIGLEVAATARNKGLKTNVFEASDRIMGRSASKHVAQFLQKYHESKGVNFLTGTMIETIKTKHQEVEIILSNNATYKTECVAVGIGVKPSSQIAEDAKLECNNGIIVDENCATNDKSIFAAGDCANYYLDRYKTRQRLESVQNAIDQAKIVASSITGNLTEYKSIPWFWSDQYDLKLKIAGLLEGTEHSVVRGSMNKNQFSVCHYKNERLHAIECINDQKTFMTGKKLIEASSEIGPDAIQDETTNLKDWL
jgi:3-phenylpropionate/trans-cinnamate dioxygenase ferredoxin reductase subunit